MTIICNVCQKDLTNPKLQRKFPWASYSDGSRGQIVSCIEHNIFDHEKITEGVHKSWEIGLAETQAIQETKDNYWKAHKQKRVIKIDE